MWLWLQDEALLPKAITVLGAYLRLVGTRKSTIWVKHDWKGTFHNEQMFVTKNSLARKTLQKWLLQSLQKLGNLMHLAMNMNIYIYTNICVCAQEVKCVFAHTVKYEQHFKRRVCVNLFKFGDYLWFRYLGFKLLMPGDRNIRQ